MCGIKTSPNTETVNVSVAGRVSRELIQPEGPSTVAALCPVQPERPRGLTFCRRSVPDGLQTPAEMLQHSQVQRRGQPGSFWDCQD